jgi:hypothetical protein
MTDPEDRFKYIDDLEIAELISLAGILVDYDILSHVPSDISVEQKFLPPQATRSQSYLDSIQNWTSDKLMKINSSKTNYMVFSRCQQDFATRLSINGDVIERKKVVKILGVWISEDAGDWSINTTEICKKSYGRISMLSKLKYAGLSVEDLLEIYCLFVRSKAEYCSVVFASSLTQEQIRKIENIEKTCLRIILQEMYIGYEEACEMLAISSVTKRRDARLLSYAKKCTRHPTNERFFPRNPNQLAEPQIRQREPFKVNFTRTEIYKKSTIPTCQRLLNDYYMEHPERLWNGRAHGGMPRGEEG